VKGNLIKYEKTTHVVKPASWNYKVQTMKKIDTELNIVYKLMRFLIMFDEFFSFHGIVSW
jgi:hypothetical protein